MINPIRGFLSLSIRLQIGVLLIVSQIAAHVVTSEVLTWFWTDTGLGPTAVGLDMVAPMTMAIRLIDRLPADEGDLAQALVATDRRLTIQPASMTATQGGSLKFPAPLILSLLRSSIPASWNDRVKILNFDDSWWGSPDPSKLVVLAQLPSGKWLAFTPVHNSIWRALPSVYGLLAVLVLAIPLAAIALWAGGTLVAPLGRLSSAIAHFSDDLDATPISESGPSEVRSVARIFNKMRERIKASIESRARVLASIGHDLRTPLTRLRLRLETSDGDVDVERLLADIRSMESMVNSALSHIRERQAPFSPDRVDLAALTETVCFDFSDEGHAVHYDGPERLVVTCDADLIRRALTNIIENAVKYAGEATVHLRPSGDSGITIAVHDHGPGIPLSEKNAAFEPFRRGEGAAGAGYGLGLSISKDIVQRHGGTIALAHNKPTGLIVSITMPVEGRVAQQ